MNHAIPDVATARRCIDALADYLGSKDDSPRAAADLRESVRILSAQSAWLPIESAPKDGHWMMVGSSEWDTPALFARWIDIRLVFIDGAECEDYMFGPPTHWMPLPAPPETP